MKKRMIAWLLCACMTFTAAPEMLLADVAGNAQQTQEENSFKEKGTVETQTVEQDDEKSAVTEKKETDQADEEDHNAGRLAEEESGAAGTEIVTEETEEPETTIVTEETEEPETKVVTEETEETETKNVTEEPEQAETENVTEETESTEEILKRALSGDEISRIDWVQELVTLFDLTVDEDNYPDNYYSDISTDDSFYRDVMVACEFGMIDLPSFQMFGFIKFNRFFPGVVALGMNSGAYLCEIIRAGIQSIDQGQTEAARSLGLSQTMNLRYIILPQALKNILPAIANEFVVIIKESAITYTIGVQDIMSAVNAVKGATFIIIEPLLVATAIYFCLCFPTSKLIAYFERRMSHGDKR